METDSSFEQIYQHYIHNINIDSVFSAACSVFMLLEDTKNIAQRLSMLYILHALYSEQPLDHNPFLTFFLEIIEEDYSSIEIHFVYCILENSITKVTQLTPQDISNHTIHLPSIEKNQLRIDILKTKVNRLINDPDITVLDENTLKLITMATKRTLTLSEIEILKNQDLSAYPLLDLILPNQLPDLIDLNQFMAVEILPLLLTSDHVHLYLQSILSVPVTLNSLEVIHDLLMNKALKYILSNEFLHYYISNSIRSCDLIEDGVKGARQVKQVTRFIQSLLENKIITAHDYLFEIKSFCVHYMKIKGVTALFRWISNETSNQQQQQQQLSVAGPS